MTRGREISEFQRGILTGASLGALAGVTPVMILFMLIVVYDMGRPVILRIGKRAIDKVITSIDVEYNIAITQEGNANREITEFQRGMITGIAIGALVGPTPMLILFSVIIAYDMGSPRLIEVVRRAINKVINVVDPNEPERVEIEISKTLDTPIQNEGLTQLERIGIDAATSLFK